MIGRTHEFAIGGLLVAPFIGYAALALLLLILLRLGFRLVGFERIFANPPLAQAALYVIILGALMVLI